MTLAVLCACAMPSDNELYVKALSALEKEGDIPASVQLAGFDNSRVYRAKNAACVELPCNIPEQSGRAQTCYRVWLKRVAMTWKFDRYEKIPDYRADAHSE